MRAAAEVEGTRTDHMDPGHTLHAPDFRLWPLFVEPISASPSLSVLNRLLFLFLYSN